MFGAGGLVWAAGWEAMMGGIRDTDPVTAALLEGEDSQAAPPRRAAPALAAGAAAAAGSAAAAAGGGAALPWRAMLRNTPVRALAYTHFCNNWRAPAARAAPRPPLPAGRPAVGALA
jgi:ACS family sodium-dependent inorganic phosphate cotransporter